MGNDGGSIPDRRDLVRNKPKAEQADKANQSRARWFFCALSKRPLQEPIVSCALGKLYNKDAIIEHLLDKTTYGDAEKICGHIHSLKDIKVLKLTQRSAPPPPDASADVARFVCPLTFKEMNGGQPFVYILPCGCVFSQSGLRTVLGSSPSNGDVAPEEKTEKDEQLEICPQCATKFSRSTDIFMLNPPLEEEERMRAAMDLRRSREPVKKAKKRKTAAVDEVATKKKKGSPEGHSPSPAPCLNPRISAASRSLTESLAVEEAKRKAGMSDAVKSLYLGKNDAPRKETFMTMGTFTRYA